MPLLDPEGRRHWREYRQPAAVIMAGVLTVVAFGLVVQNTADRGEEPRASAPAAGEPSQQLPIPLPTAAGSPSFTPVDSIAIERVPIASRIDLAARGTIDWVHWGEQGRFSLERKAGGGFSILEGTPTEPRNRLTAGPQRYAWTGGEPLAASSGATSGIGTCGSGHGFTLSAPAGIQQNTLTLYVGATKARGRLRVELSTGGDIVTDVWGSRGESMATTAYVISYRASATGKISVKWITASTYDENCGGVALQAATLS
ncbi:hypothetical protein QLQ12_26965 [Actinoplanes sp. NEAU-A12]|uniref:Uncharacterized protein n=1 Tax=Actinoplanes sandaracinus TaxID=3045177 RepID=A0ABT6WRA2_9ACTN|nr:hypothetical protein [Actinoplanes sandaracinus]MDI6102265.1 hypothetical protein [Actinoplanes sandaracinus]